VTSLQQWTVELVGPKGYIHGWVKVEGMIQHKDSSRGRVTAYDKNTQTAHVDWHSGPRARVNGGKGTTKAYHIHSIDDQLDAGLRQQTHLIPDAPAKTPKQAQDERIRGATGQRMAAEKAKTLDQFKAYGGKVAGDEPKLTGREKALHGTKFLDSAPKPKVEIKRPADPFATIPNAYGDGEPSKPTPYPVEIFGAEKLPGREGLNRLTSQLMDLHQRYPLRRGLPVIAISPPGAPQVANYNSDIHMMTAGTDSLKSKDYAPAGFQGRERGYTTPTGNASFLERTATHEYGHALDAQLSPSQRQQMFAEVETSIPGVSAIGQNAPYSWIQQNKAAIVNKVGTYASTSDEELIAELFAEFVHSTTPSPAAQVVGKYLKGRA